MGMYSLIEDARTKAMDAANCWHETDEARALIAKIEAFERLSDRWCGACVSAANGFMEGAREAEDELDDLRNAAIDAAAATYSTNRTSDEWLCAWDAAEEDTPPVKQILNAARRDRAGDGYLERFAA